MGREIRLWWISQSDLLSLLPLLVSCILERKIAMEKSRASWEYKEWEESNRKWWQIGQWENNGWWLWLIYCETMGQTWEKWDQKRRFHSDTLSLSLVNIDMYSDLYVCVKLTRCSLNSNTDTWNPRQQNRNFGNKFDKQVAGSLPSLPPFFFENWHKSINDRTVNCLPLR